MIRECLDWRPPEFEDCVMLRMFVSAFLLLGAPAALAAQSRPAAASRSACAPAPNLVLAADFADPRGAFAPGSGAFRRTAANFAAAYRQACARGLLRRRALVGPSAGGRLFLRNAPEANVASIYLDGEEGASAAARRPVLEYFFVTDDGATHVPSMEDLGEAIFCHVQGASEREQEESGRCLVD